MLYKTLSSLNCRFKKINRFHDIFENPGPGASARV